MAILGKPLALHAVQNQYIYRIFTKYFHLKTILGSLAITSVLSALDISVIATALPSIIRDLGASPAYAWVANSYFLTSTAFQPIFGQTANIFGRRSLTIFSVVMFAVGSAVSGSAQTLAALITGRTIQGIGGGGINVLVELIVCDLVPMRQRPKFMGVIFSAFAVAVSIGPVVGGALAQSNWRWIFYLNLPICAVALVLLALFLQVNYKKDSFANMVRRVDLSGNALLIAAIVAVLLALTYGGAEQPWSSWRIIVPLVLGIAGFAAFLVLESTKLVPEPTMPFRLFSNRTSLAAFGITFIHATLTYWISYFLPVYFQSVLERTPTQSGVDVLPSAIATLPFAMIAGAGVSVFNRYRPWHFIGFGLLAIGYGLFARMDQSSSAGYWLGIQFIAAAGLGVLFTTTLPPIQAPLGEEDTAVATATWGFVRSFGGIWGVAIPSAIFNSRVDQLLYRVDSFELRSRLVNGGAYALASKEFMQSLDSTPVIKQQVTAVYVDALRLCWQVGIAFALLGFLVSLIIKEVPMRESLENDYGIIENPKKNDNVEMNRIA